MDPTIIVGLVMVVLILLEAIGLEAGLTLFLNKEAGMIVGGGLIAASLINFPFGQLKQIGNWFKVLFFSNRRNYRADILMLIRLSFKMNREGRASLEQEIAKIEDNFLRYAMIQVMNKVEPEQIKGMLKEMIEQSERRHEQGIHYFEQLAKYSPGLALIGTLIGLVKLLANLSDPKLVGPNMAIALVATFYGVASSNLIFLPLAGRLKVSSYAEQVHKEILIEGILAMAQGELPLKVREKIYSLVTEKDRNYLRANEKH